MSGPCCDGKTPIFTNERAFKEQQCPLCLEVLCNPVAGSCEHTFCYECLKAHIAQSPRFTECPICKQQSVIEYRSVAKHRNSAINTLSVACPHKKCEWTGHLDTFAAHIKVCNWHEVLCPSGCQRRLTRGLLAQHEEKDCPNQKVPCKFAKVGCAFSGPSQTHAQHQKDCVEAHNELMLRALVALPTALKDKKQRGGLKMVRPEAETFVRIVVDFPSIYRATLGVTPFRLHRAVIIDENNPRDICTLNTASWPSNINDFSISGKDVSLVTDGQLIRYVGEATLYFPFNTAVQKWLNQREMKAVALEQHGQILHVVLHSAQGTHVGMFNIYDGRMINCTLISKTKCAPYIRREPTYGAVVMADPQYSVWKIWKAMFKELELVAEIEAPHLRDLQILPDQRCIARSALSPNSIHVFTPKGTFSIEHILPKPITGMAVVDTHRLVLMEESGLRLYPISCLK